MKKRNVKILAFSSIVGLGSVLLYKYRKMIKVEKNTEQYIEKLEEPKRKYITLYKRKGKK